MLSSKPHCPCRQQSLAASWAAVCSRLCFHPESCVRWLQSPCTLAEKYSANEWSESWNCGWVMGRSTLQNGRECTGWCQGPGNEARAMRERETELQNEINIRESLLGYKILSLPRWLSRTNLKAALPIVPEDSRGVGKALLYHRHIGLIGEQVPSDSITPRSACEMAVHCSTLQPPLPSPHLQPGCVPAQPPAKVLPPQWGKT